MYVFMYVYVYMYVCTYVCAYMYACGCVDMYGYDCLYMLCLYMCTCLLVLLN